MASPKKKRLLRSLGIPGVRGSVPLEQPATEPAPEPVKTTPAPAAKPVPKPVVKPAVSAPKVALKPKKKKN
tara:strand:- start:60 stop:272 length:213 start_codon:yes stop_codon:yes gene_type:complete